MAAHPEQINGCLYVGPQARRDVKRDMRRKIRREGKALLDDAPKRREFRGWAD